MNAGSRSQIHLPHCIPFNSHILGHSTTILLSGASWKHDLRTRRGHVAATVAASLLHVLSSPLIPSPRHQQRLATAAALLIISLRTLPLFRLLSSPACLPAASSSSRNTLLLVPNLVRDGGARARGWELGVSE